MVEELYEWIDSLLSIDLVFFFKSKKANFLAVNLLKSTYEN